jgi:hypothetical protein
MLNVFQIESEHLLGFRIPASPRGPFATKAPGTTKILFVFFVVLRVPRGFVASSKITITVYLSKAPRHREYAVF